MASKLAIEIDTTSNLAGVAQTKSALDDLAVRSVPQLNASLKALQAQAAGLTDALAKPFGPAALKQFQIELDSTNAEIAQTKEQIAALGAGMEAAGGQSQAALGGMMSDMRELRNVVRLAFAPIMVVGFLEILAKVPEEIRKGTDALYGFDQQAKDTLKSIQDLNAALTGPTNLFQAAGGEANIQKQIADLKKQKEDLEGAAAMAAAAGGESFGGGYAASQQLYQVNKALDDLQSKLPDAEKAYNKFQETAGKTAQQDADDWIRWGQQLDQVAAETVKTLADAQQRLDEEMLNTRDRLARTATSGPGSIAVLTPGLDTKQMDAIIKQAAEQQRLLEDMRAQGLGSLQKFADREAKLEQEAAARHDQLTQRVSELDQQALDGRFDKTAAALARVTAEEQRQFDQLQKMYGKDADNYELLQRAKADMDAIAAQRRREIIDAEADKWQSFYDRNIKNAKSFSDAMKNIAGELQNYFGKLVFRSIVGGLYGQPGAMGGAPSGTATGGAGGIFGDIFSGGFGSGIIKNAFPEASPAGAPMPEAAMSMGALGIAGGGLSLAQVTSSTGILGISGGGAGAAVAEQPAGNIAIAAGLPATTPIGTVLQKISQASAMDKFAMGLGIAGISTFNDNSAIGSVGRAASAGMLGFGLGQSLGMTGMDAGLTALGMAGVSVGRTIGHAGGAIIGAAGGALSGFEIGNMVFPGIGGVVGAAAGAIVGGLMALLGGNPDKVADTKIQQQGEAQMFATLKDYERQRIDFASAVQRENDLYNAMVGRFKRSESHIIPQTELTNILAEMSQVEDERNRRRQIQSMQAVPEFDIGGPIPGAAGQPVPIIAHGGEFMMTAQAVQRIGTSVLQGLNTATPANSPSGGDGFMAQVWLPSKEFAADIVRRGIPIVIGRGGPASRALRS